MECTLENFRELSKLCETVEVAAKKQQKVHEAERKRVEERLAQIKNETTILEERIREKDKEKELAE
jgi:hypothetical protein